jgi:DNA-binding GntR family transcriptional regulator
VTGRTYDEIRGAILRGRYPTGTRLPEEELAQAFGVSRTPVREALRSLHAEGLVEFIPNRGAHVATWTHADLQEIYDLRALLEGRGAELATPRITDEAIEHLRVLAAGMEALVPSSDRSERSDEHVQDRISELNNEFHQAILQAAGSRQLVALVSNVVHVPLVRRTFRRYDAVALARSFAHHRDLIAAFEARDPLWAGSVMRTHVYAARAVLAQDHQQDQQQDQQQDPANEGTE